MKEGPLDWLADDNPTAPAEISAALDQCENNAWPYHWGMQARGEQLPPPGDWRIWLILAGRGFGKTRAGAEWVRAIAESCPEARIALVAATLSEARAVMVEGESGIIACCAPDNRPVFEASLKRLRFPNGAQALIYSAQEPESLRGPQHSHAWCDEIGKWPLAHERATRCWDNLLMGLRLGHDPRIIATTTPRAVPVVERLVKQAEDGEVALTRGSTFDNVGNLPRRFIAAITSEFAGSQLARQELDGELVADIEGALWTRALIERCRFAGEAAPLVRVVVAVDPPASATGDECGIVVAALGEDGIGRVLADCSIAQASPAQWAAAVVAAAQMWQADRVIAEANQGGAMVESVLRAADHVLPVKLVHATRGKAARAEPVAALYAAGKVHHCGMFARLEDQLCGLLTGGTYAGPGRSPDRADALVWALTELLLRPSARPGIRTI
ncbi:MAG: DNA-packaging protein [Erythrobacter sp.]